ncbi:hypothetical protein H1R20_g3886, partial [Candolleomyces eurysporus]
MTRGIMVPVATSNSNLSGSPSFSIPSTSASNGNTTASLGNPSNSFYRHQSFTAIPSQSNTQIGNGNYSFREAPTPGPSSRTTATTSGFHSTDTDTEIESDTDIEMDGPEQLGGIKSAGSFLDVVGASATTPTATATHPEDVVGVSDMSFLRRFLPFLFRSRSSRSNPPVTSTATHKRPSAPEQSYDDEEEEGAGWSQSYYNQHFQSQHPGPNRSASPAPTEIDDPEPEYLEQQLAMHGAKIQDFAYEKTDERYTLAKIPELWDQYEGISEYEYRLSQNPRTYPIAGRTIHRLIELGWVDKDEVEERCAGMDLDELRKFESREIWPWTLKYKSSPKCTERPDMNERMVHMHTRRWIFMRLDKMRRSAELQELKKLRETAEVEEAIRKGREFSEVMSKRKGKKRALDEDDENEEGGEEFDGDVECDDQSISTGGRSSRRRNRRRRMKKTNWDEELDLEFDYGDHHHDQNRSSPFSHLPSAPPMPTKQYPAPLFSYDPQIYPDAAKEIEFQQSQSQQYSQQMNQLCGVSYLQQSQAAASGSQQPYSSYQEYQQQQQQAGGSSSQGQGSQYQPVYSIYPARPVHDRERPVERCDTPPLEEDDNRPNKLVRPAKRGLGLTRTQTFTQL